RNIAFRLEQPPFLTALIDEEANRRQNLSIESLGRFAIFHPEIDVIEEARAHTDTVTDWRDLSNQRASRFSRRIINFKPDQVSSTAQTFTSTNPSGRQTSRITFSVI